MQCANCPLKNPRCAEGTGNPQAKIVVIGRNPGKTEAETGEPFTGRSGELLDAILEEVHLDRNDLWITNAVNCHVEEDGLPTSEMYDACRPRLMQELAEVNPKIILSMGNEATRTLGVEGNIMSLLGSLHPLKASKVEQTNFPGIDAWILPTFHPSYILHGNFDGFDDLKDAIERAKALAEGTRPLPKPLPYDKVHYITEEAQAEIVLYHLCSGAAGFTLAIDTETDFIRDPTYKLLLLQIGNGEDAWVFEADLLTKPGSVYDLFQAFLQDERFTWVFHNLSFDLKFLIHYWHTVPKHIEDTMMYAMCLSEKLQHAGLKRLVNKYLSVPHYEQALAKYLTHKGIGYSAIPREVLVPYAGFDVIFTRQLFDVMKEEVRKEGNERLYPLLVQIARMFCEMSYNGIIVDTDYIAEVEQEYVPLLDKLEKEIQAYAMWKGYKATEVVKNSKVPWLSVNSPKQMKYFLNTYCGFDTQTTDKRFMEANEGHEFIDMVYRFRKVEHLLNVYIRGIADDVWPDGRVHPDFFHGSVTGRITIENPPLMTTPANDFVERYKVKSVRKLFKVAPGYKFFHADYSQLEIRVCWHITGDENLGAAVMSQDLHRTMAGMVYNKPPEQIDKFERNQSKMVTFGMLYGRQAPSLAKFMGVSVAEAKAFLAKFAAQFPKYFGWWKGQQERAIDTGFLETEFGRRRRWNLITPDNVLEIQRQAVNFPVQSTASDITLTSMLRIDELLKSKGWGRPLFSVHDSVELEVREDVVEEAIPLIIDIMEHPLENTCAVFKVKVQIGNNFDEASAE